MKADTDKGPEAYGELYAKHKATDASPYIQIAWAAKLYETGKRANVEQARDVLKRVLQEHGKLDLVQRLVPA